MACPIHNINFKNFFWSSMNLISSIFCFSKLFIFTCGCSLQKQCRNYQIETLFNPEKRRYSTLSIGNRACPPFKWRACAKILWYFPALTILGTHGKKIRQIAREVEKMLEEFFDHRVVFTIQPILHKDTRKLNPQNEEPKEKTVFVWLYL